MLNRERIRNILLSFPLLREVLFFIFQKKVYKRRIDKKISALLKNSKKLSERRINTLIVSLTSFPQRIEEIKYTIYSLLEQTVLPEKIILWLEKSRFPNKEQDLPEELLVFKKFGLAINWCEDLRSYAKLIPALEQYPDLYIVTADDDVYYKKKWLEKLWLEHQKYPGDIVCHIADKILFHNENILPHVKWKRSARRGSRKYQMFGLGVGGILYSKEYLYKDISRKDLFLNLAPYADDIWFYFMAVLNGTRVRVVRNSFKVKCVNPYREYGLNEEYRLSSVNIDDGLDDQQFKNVIDYYNLDLYSLINEK